MSQLFKGIKPITFELQRLDRSSSPAGYSKVTDIEVYFIPSDAEMQVVDFGLEKRFTGVVDSSVDIRRGDRLVYNDNKYNVAGVSEYALGVVNHKEITLEQVTDE